MTVLFSLLLAAGQGDLTREAMRGDLAALARDVRAQWSYCEDKRAHFGVDVDLLVAAEIAALPESATPAEFDQLLQRLVASLGDGHASVRYAEPLPLPARRWPFALQETSEGLALVRCLIDEGPAVGDLLRGVDGRPTEELWLAARELTVGSTPGMRRLNALERLQRSDATALAFEFEGADGARTTWDLPTLVADDPRLETPAEEPWSVGLVAPGVARLRIASFGVPDWRAWSEADQEGRDAMLAGLKASIDALLARLVELAPEALILDVRGNGGGTDWLGIHFAERLLPEPFVYFKLSALNDGVWSEPFGQTYGKAEDLPRVVVPTFALIDTECFSTTDNFLRALDVLHPDLTTIGRPTGAGTGAPRVVSVLPASKAMVTLCTQRVYGPDDKLIEGRGTVPDVPVAWSNADLRAGRDPDLEAALELARKRGLGP